MSFKTKLNQALEALIETPEKDKTPQDEYRTTLFNFIENDKTRKIQELESLVCGLSSKVTVLTDKVQQLNERIVNLTTLSEELLYTIEQTEQREDNLPVFNLNSEEKKYGLN